MTCTKPGAVTPGDLLAFAEGEPRPTVAAHIGACPSCRAEAEALAGLGATLGTALHRFDCPPPQALGEYALDLLSEPGRIATAAHVRDCPACMREIQTLRGFLAVEVPANSARSLAVGLRRVVATLLAPGAPALAGAALRGRESGGVRTYVADGVTVALGTLPEHPRRRDLYSVEGLITAETAIAEEVALEGDSAIETTVSQVDDLGNFSFTAVPAGAYRLVVRLADREVVVEDFRVE